MKHWKYSFEGRIICQSFGCLWPNVGETITLDFNTYTIASLTAANGKERLYELTK